jgi:hypothetical protein
MSETEPAIPNPDAEGLIPYFQAPADEPNPAEESK